MELDLDDVLTPWTRSRRLRFPRCGARL